MYPAASRPQGWILVSVTKRDKCRENGGGFYRYTCVSMSMFVYKAQCSCETWAGLSYVAVTLQSFHFKAFSLGPNLSKRTSLLLEPVLGHMLEQTWEQREPISTQAVMKGSSLGNLTSLVML